MMKDTTYYKELAERYLDAETTIAEERELKAFLATTHDLAFDETKAVMGVEMVAGRKGNSATAQNRAASQHNPILLWGYSAAASVVLLIAVSLFMLDRDAGYVMIASGQKTTNSDMVMSEVDSEMAMILNDNASDMESEMAQFFE